jgi:hypothetical protein
VIKEVEVIEMVAKNLQENQIKENRIKENQIKENNIKVCSRLYHQCTLELSLNRIVI